MSAMGSTPSQLWARLKGACSRGRRDLGWKSIGEYFRTSRNKGNLYWILVQLTTWAPENLSRRLPEWVDQMDTSVLTPKQMRTIAYENNVTIPMEIS